MANIRTFEQALIDGLALVVWLLVMSVIVLTMTFVMFS